LARKLDDVEIVGMRGAYWSPNPENMKSDLLENKSGTLEDSDKTRAGMTRPWHTEYFRMDYI
jgi:hypothetical protein